MQVRRIACGTRVTDELRLETQAQTLHPPGWGKGRLLEIQNSPEVPQGAHRDPHVVLQE